MGKGSAMFDVEPLAVTLARAEEYFARHQPVIAEPPPAYAGPRAWFVVQAASRAEDDVVAILKDRGHDAYLPKMRKDVFHRRAKKIVTRTFVLFNRYVFAELPASPDCWGDLLDQEPVAHILGYLGPKDVALMERVRLAEADLEFDETREAAIHRKQIGRNKRETAMLKFKPGSRVRARTGPFGGFSGQVTSVNGRGAVNVLLEIFARATPVEFAADQVDIEDSDAIRLEQG